MQLKEANRMYQKRLFLLLGERTSTSPLTIRLGYLRTTYSFTFSAALRETKCIYDREFIQSSAGVVQAFPQKDDIKHEAAHELIIGTTCHLN